MKKILTLVILTCICINLMACTNGGTDANESEPTRIKIARPVDSSILDPVMSGKNPEIWMLTLVVESLLAISDDGQSVIPGIAETWEKSSDNLSFTFHLYDNLMFSDGSPVTRDDLLWNLERVMTTVEGANHYLYSNWDSIEVPDDRTVIIHMKEARAFDDEFFTYFPSGIISKAHYYGEVSNDFTSQVPIGTGPFYFAEWKQDEYMVLAKNPYYRFADQVIADEVIFTIVPDDNTRIMQLQAGEVDIITHVPLNRMDDLENTDGLTAFASAASTSNTIFFNCSVAPFNQTNVRQALAMAIDRQDIVDVVLFGYGTPATTFLPLGIPYSNQNINTHSYDIDAAKQLLTDAGYPDGLEMTITISAGDTIQEQIAVLLTDQWGKIGINVTIQTVEDVVRREMRDNIQINHISTWSSDIPDPSQIVSFWCIPSVLSNMGTGWENSKAEDLAIKAEVELNKEKQSELYTELQELYAEEVPAIVLYYSGNPVAMKDSISGFVQIPFGNYRMNGLTISD